MSKPWKLSTAVPTKRSAKSVAVTLPTQATASPPASRIACTASAAGASSRSLTTMRAPSLARWSAIARPMPRPEPVTSATLPSSLGVMFMFPWEFSGQRDQRLADDLGLAELVGAAQLDAHAGLALVHQFLDHAAAAAHRVAEMGDALEARVEAAQPALRRPLREQPSEPGHAEHALGEHVRHAGAPREVGVDVDRVVVARGAGEEGQRAALDRRQLQRGQLVADLDGVMRVHGVVPFNAGRRSRCAAPRPARRAGWWRAP